MSKTDFMSLYEELSVLNESKEDVAKFIQKFGEDTYELFKKSNQRLKNKGISTDLTYHVKHTNKKDLDAILLNLQNRAITKDDSLTELAGDYEYLGEGKGYKVYKINDVVASINLGTGTGWCISGRYEHYGEKNYKPTRREAEKHWNYYTSRGIKFYFFIGNDDKLALALYPQTFIVDKIVGNTFVNETNCEIYNEQDELDYGSFQSLPVDLIGNTIIFEAIQAENGLYIKDNVLVKCDNWIKNAVIPDGITKIADYAFSSCDDRLKTVTIPDSVTSIGKFAFFNCTSLMNVIIGKGVKSIGSNAFTGCSGLMSVTIPDSVTSIGSNAFTYCIGLTSITIPDSVTSIGIGAFLDCSGLINVIIGNGVTSIGNGAFYDCLGLTSVTIGNSMTSIGKWAFYNCNHLTSVTIPSSVTNIGSSAFEECNSLAHVNYKGTEEQWNKIQIGDDNSCLTFAQRNYI